MCARHSVGEFYIADLSLFTYTYWHDPGLPMYLDWPKLADQDTHLPGIRMEIPESLVEMAFDAPDALKLLMLTLKPNLQQHGFEQAISNLRTYADSIPRYAGTGGERLPWTLDQSTWRNLVWHSYGIAYRDIHPLHICFAQQLVEALVVGKRESPAVRRKLFALAKRPLRGCAHRWRGLRPTALEELDDLPIVRLLDRLQCPILFWGTKIGLRPLGEMRSIDLSGLSSDVRRITGRMRRSLVSYKRRKQELAEELFTENIWKMTLTGFGVAVGITAIAVVFSRPFELTADWLKDLAEASAAGAAGIAFLVDGIHMD